MRIHEKYLSSVSSAFLFLTPTSVTSFLFRSYAKRFAFHSVMHYFSYFSGDTINVASRMESTGEGKKEREAFSFSLS